MGIKDIILQTENGNKTGFLITGYLPLVYHRSPVLGILNHVPKSLNKQMN